MKINSLNLPKESMRLKIKELAEDIRLKYARKGLSDIFDILSEASFLIRKPLKLDELSGFSTFFQNHFIVYLNSSYTLGHERFTAAHELYHIVYNADILKKEKLLLKEEQYKEDDEKANVFAAEFLMPEDYVKEIFYKIINVDDDNLEPKHVVRMHNYFKVSYKAMLKRLIQLRLCAVDNYDKLVDVCSLANKEKLQILTRKEGYDIDLIVPSNKTYISKEYIEFVKSNYEGDAISYKKMKNCFNFIGLSPEQFGYDYPKEEVL